jgi:hypothetical protein
MNPQQMLNQVRIAIDEPAQGSSPFWHNAELMHRLHDSQGYIYRKMVQARDNMFLQSTDIDLVQGTGTYDLPLNARLGVQWALIENRISGANPPLYVADIRFQDTLMMEGPIGVTNPSDSDFAAVLERDKLRLSPAPGATLSAGIRFWYNPMFGNMNQGTVKVPTTTLTTTLLPDTPTFNKGATSEDPIDKRDDYYNAMDITIVSDTTTNNAAGQVRRITDYSWQGIGDTDFTHGTVTHAAWTTQPSAAAVYAILCPIPEDFHDLVCLRAAMLAASKRPRLLPFIKEQYMDAYQEAIGFVTADQSFRGNQVIPTDQGSY